MEFPTLESQKKFFTSICELGNIEIKWSPRGIQPWASYSKPKGATIVLSAPSAVGWTRWLWDAYHEVGHVMPDLLYHYEALKMVKDQDERNILNILVDGLNESHRHGMWPGRDRALYNGVFEFSQESADTWLLERPSVFQAVSYWDDTNRQDWQGIFKMPKITPDAMKMVTEKLNGMSLETRLKDNMITQDPKGLHQIVLDILGETQQQQKEQQQQKDKGKGGKDNNDGGGGQCQDPDEAGEGHKGDGRPDGPEGSANNPEGSANNPKGSANGSKPRGREQQQQEQSQGSPPDRGNSPAGQQGASGEGQQDQPSVSGAVQASSSDLGDGGKYKDAGRELPLRPKKEAYSTSYTPLPKMNISMMPDHKPLGTNMLFDIKGRIQGSTVSKKIQKYLKIMSKDSWERGLTSGRLNTKALHKIYSANNDGNYGGAKIFKRKNQQRLKVDTAISLLLDRSGSMKSDGKYATGAASVYLISETLRELRIPFEAACFRTMGSTNYHEFYKRFDEPSVSRDILLNRLASCSIQKTWGCNADGENVMLAAERLMAQQGQPNKLLIVLSDGQPTSNAQGSDDWYLKQVVGLVEGCPSMGIIGIGIKTDVVKEFYRNYAVVDKVEDLDDVLFEVLKENLV